MLMFLYLFFATTMKTTELGVCLRNNKCKNMNKVNTSTWIEFRIRQSRNHYVWRYYQDIRLRGVEPPSLVAILGQMIREARG